jgi:hypothetical protein
MSPDGLQHILAARILVIVRNGRADRQIAFVTASFTDGSAEVPSLPSRCNRSRLAQISARLGHPVEADVLHVPTALRRPAHIVQILATCPSAAHTARSTSTASSGCRAVLPAPAGVA